ncbi:MAG TPA: cupin domain-containing protein [Rubricoccaceae bacterium]|jgi:mannose-6-phosphate isomerase-like protein (cupin superfamily)
MIIRRDETKTFPIPNCHGGAGAVVCREVLADYDRATAGFTLVHDDTLAPGVSVGEHRHVGDEEIYVILEGEGEMVVDGVVHAVGPGDVCVTRTGETHGITNTGEGELRVLVVGATLGPTTRATL